VQYYSAAKSIIHEQTVTGKRELNVKDILLLDSKPEPAIFFISYERVGPHA
jgi:hypothetical protein